MAELGLKDTFRARIFEPLLRFRGADGGPAWIHHSNDSCRNTWDEE